MKAMLALRLVSTEADAEASFLCTRYYNLMGAEVSGAVVCFAGPRGFGPARYCRALGKKPPCFNARSCVARQITQS